MRNIANIIIIFILSAFTTSAEPLDNTENLTFEVSYFNAVNKSAVNLQKYFEKYPAEEHEVIVKSDRFINSILKAELFRLADVYAEQSNVTPSMKAMIGEKVKNSLLRVTKVTL